MMDDEDDFFSTCDDDEPVPEELRTLGLVVPLRALTPEENGGVDELVELEAKFRRKGRPDITFEDDEE